jgi:hypothetical protein
MRLIDKNFVIGVSGDRAESYSCDENGNRRMTGYTVPRIV